MRPLWVAVCVVLALAVGTAFGRWTAGLETPVPAAPVARTVTNPHAESPSFLPKRALEPSRDSPASNGPVTVHGVIREVIQVPNYTYLRLSHDGKPDAWAAVESNPSLTVDAKVTVTQAMLMQDFTSKSLGRTFSEIYFGRLE